MIRIEKRATSIWAIAFAVLLANGVAMAAPNRAETEKWILGKIKKYGHPYTVRGNRGNYVWSLKYFKINKCSIEFKVNLKYKVRIYKQNQENYYKYIVPIANIKKVSHKRESRITNSFDNYGGLEIENSPATITRIRNTKRLKKRAGSWRKLGSYRSSHGFSYAVLPFNGRGREPNLIARMNRAFLHLKALAVKGPCKRRKETF